MILERRKRGWNNYVILEVNGSAWSVLLWFRTGTSDQLFWTEQWTSGYNLFEGKFMRIRGTISFSKKTLSCGITYWMCYCQIKEQHNISLNSTYLFQLWGTAVAQWLRCCVTNRKDAGSNPDGIIGIFQWHNPSDRTMALGSTQPLTEMNTRSITLG